MRSLLYRLRALLLRRRVEREMREEMDLHIERATERMIVRGLSPKEARSAALREFGNEHYLQEQARDVRGARWLDSLTPDAKLALRMLVKSPVLTLVGGLGMAVGVAIATGFFAFMSFYYSDAPVEEGDRVVSVAYIDGDDERSTLFDYQLWKAELETVVDLAAYRRDYRDLESPTYGPVETQGVAMTASGFRVARVPPLLGRPLLASDEVPGAMPVLVLGHREWQDVFGGDPDVVGSEVHLDGAALTVVGVMPPDFRLPSNHGFWTALETGAQADVRADEPDLNVFGRLAPGVEAAAAEAELAAIAGALAARYPDVYERYRPAVSPYIRHLFDVQHYPGWIIWLMQLFAALVLTVVAVNVALLVYARTAIRRAEITVRTALGASRSRIVTQLFVEALALSSAAAAGGLLIAQVGYRQLTMVDDVRDNFPHWIVGDLPPGTMLYAVGLAVLAAFVVGVLPALQATGRNVEATLRELGGGTGLRMGRTWTALICTQVAVAVGVLPAIVGIAWNYSPPPKPTFGASEIISLSLRPPPDPAPHDSLASEHAASTYGLLQAELLRRVEATPGVTSVTFATSLPQRYAWRRIEVEGAAIDADSPSRGARPHFVAPGYFSALDVPVLAGREFDRGDVESGANVAIVNRSFVERNLGGGAALGRRFREIVPGGAQEASGPWLEIVGVVEDMLRPRRGRPWSATYRPVALGTAPLNLAARTRGVEPASVALRVRSLAQELAPDLDLTVNTVDTFYRGDVRELRVLLLTVGLMTLSVLLLSAAGISAMMSFAVTTRRREIGIRTALGASRDRLIRSIFARSVRQLGLGLVIGCTVSAYLDRLTGGEMLKGQAAPLLAVVATIMLGAGLLATLGPARRALRTQPMEALREE